MAISNKTSLFPEMEGELYTRRPVARTSVLPELTRVFQISLCATENFNRKTRAYIAIH